MAAVTNLNYQFSGLVQSVEYDDKGYPTVKVTGIAYPLVDLYDFKRSIQNGDSIVKLKGSRVYKLFKKDLKNPLIFE